ncbi:hypothetical protein HY469_01125 [Candidatus Roizmanbacteria bacterium]|nr:hypothetical protein [Candidatus Roizmanbacteria bacterium]
MQVIIDGKQIRLHQVDQLGAGGEGVVYKSRVEKDILAVKVYHQPDARRAQKLQTFLAKSWTLPISKIAMPLQLVYDVKGRTIIGLTMPLLSSGFEELMSLSNKKYRASFLVNTRMVADIFLDGGHTVNTIHQNGLVIGDFNDLNGVFRGTEMLFIDVDAWQFDTFPCPVGTEQFLAPELYGIDLSSKPVFRPEHDWYSFAVMLFKSLLLVHPYGGTHKDVKQLVQRATRRITVFDAKVTYPKIGLAPDILNDDLAHVFEQFFAVGKRGPFPLDMLQAYAENLTECTSCGAFYPASRIQCPICHAKTIIIITRPVTVTKGVQVTEFIRTQGSIVFHKVTDAMVVVIAYENGKAVLYTKRGILAPKRKELFNEIPGARFELVGDVLIVNMPNSTELLLMDVSEDAIKPIMKSETSIYAGNRRAVFRASDRYLFRIVSGNLMYGEVKYDQLIERPLRSVMMGQTWFVVRTRETGNKPVACGFFQVLQQQMFWLVWEGRSFDNMSLSQLDLGELLVDLTVKFSSQGTLVRRLTQFQGVNYIRTDMINTNGVVAYSSSRVRKEDHPAPFLHGQAYSTGKLLSATDDGVIQEDVQSGQIKTFDATKGFVEEGDTLYPYQGGLLVVKESTVVHVMLS